MKSRLWLSALIPPALLALIYVLAQFVDSVSVQPNGALWPSRVYFVLAGIGMVAGLAPLLCLLAEGRRGFCVNAGVLLAGILVLSCAGWARAAAYGLNADYLDWVYSDVCLALFAFGGALLTGSFSFGESGKRVFFFRWRQVALLLSVAAVAYASYAAMNLLYHNMPHHFSFDNFDPRPGPDFITMMTVRNSLEMLLMALTVLFLPMATPTSSVRVVMKTYGLLFSAVALLFLAGYITEVTGFQPGVHVSKNPLAKLFSAINSSNLVMLYAVFVMAGVTLKLGFGRNNDNNQLKYNNHAENNNIKESDQELSEKIEATAERTLANNLEAFQKLGK